MQSIVRRSSLTAPGFLLWLALLILTLRPLAPVERAVDILVAPLRLVSELAFPMVFLRHQRVQAAERRLADAAPLEAAENERLLTDLAESAMPTDSLLFRNRRIVHAEVLGRERDQDHLRIRLRDARGISAGMPVAFGDVYVGRIQGEPSSNAAPHTTGTTSAGNSGAEVGGEAVVELVTTAGFHVGARVAPEGPEGRFLAGGSGDVLLTVGGVRSGPGGKGRRRASIRLAAHQPSDRSRLAGVVRVHELFDEEGDFAELAEGLILGNLNGGEFEEPWIAPEIDYLDGLFHVVVLTPEDPTLGSALPFETVLRDTNWVRTRPLGIGDPSPDRSACKIRMGRLDGVRPGAAVTSVGANLVGRVAHAGLLTADVSFLGDPGFSVVAVARFDGLQEPKVLGRLDALGRDPSQDSLHFQWTVRVALGAVPDDGSGYGRARLYTGSGDPGLPAGFAFGTAWIPLGAEPGEEHLIEVIPDVPPSDLYGLFVRTIPAGSAAVSGSEPGQPSSSGGRP